jgi:flavin-dependent dehydrogenase
MSAANGLVLQDGSVVGVVGGGPAGSFFSYFLLSMAETVGLDLKLDLYEPRDFSVPGPGGCNMCGGIISESLVQNLATEGIQLPNVIQRSIDSYCLHMDLGDVHIETPRQEKRIAAVHRGGGPRGIKVKKFGGLDGHLLNMAMSQGARWIRGRVESLSFQNGRPQLRTQAGEEKEYDLVVVAVGVNSSALKMFEAAGIGYKPPRATKAYICEFLFTRDVIRRELGSSMHVFLLNIPRLDFAALIPKDDYVTLCLLGRNIDKELVDAFVNSTAVKECLPANWQPPPDFCHCSPKISIASAVRPYGDRIVFVGDCGTTRLYKDGIGAAYRAAKAAARTTIFHGVAAKDYRKHYWPVCRTIRQDNILGKLVFLVTHQIQNWAFARRALWTMVSKEQLDAVSPRRMSGVLWDTFTGSAPYWDVLLRSLHPSFLSRFAWEMARALGHRRHSQEAAP